MKRKVKQLQQGQTSQNFDDNLLNIGSHLDKQLLMSEKQLKSDGKCMSLERCLNIKMQIEKLNLNLNEASNSELEPIDVTSRSQINSILTADDFEPFNPPRYVGSYERNHPIKAQNTERAKQIYNQLRQLKNYMSKLGDVHQESQKMKWKHLQEYKVQLEVEMFQANFKKQLEVLDADQEPYHSRDASQYMF